MTAAPMTYFVSIGFARPEDGGDLYGIDALEAQTESAAKSRARALASKYAGAVAFSRRGGPQVGDYDDAVILARYGETPDDLNGLAMAG